MHVYVITNTVNGKIYVGQTVQPLERYWKYNLRCAALGKTYKPALYSAIRKYGADRFIIEAIGEAHSKSDLDNWERVAILVFGAQDKKIGYNLTAGGDGTLGAVRTQVWKANISKGNTGKLWDDARKKRASQSRRGVKLSEEHKRRIGDGVRGKKKPPSWVAALSERNKKLKGTHLSEERKLAISEALRGRPVSEATREKMRNSHNSADVRERKRKSMLATLARKREVEGNVIFTT